MKQILFLIAIVLILINTACHSTGKSRGGTNGAGTISTISGTATNILRDSANKVKALTPPPPPVTDDQK